MESKRRYYGAYSYMGVNFTYDSPCWTAYGFDSKAERDAWVADGEYNDQSNRVKTAISRKEAQTMAGSDLRRLRDPKEVY